MTDLFFDTALLPSGWARSVRMTVDDSGAIAAIESDGSPDGAHRLSGVAVPGVPNVHSHAFQRAMAGLTERGSTTGDTFWTWRERMYGFLRRLDPDAVGRVAAQLFVELLEGGFTSVAEFHYLRNDPQGDPYDDPVEMARRILGAAERCGIGITMLPTLYRSSNFGGVPPTEGQWRFVSTVDELLSDISVLSAGAASASVRVGLGLHSLRAVGPDELAAAVHGARALDSSLPIHIHVAEQLREVEASLAWSGARPVAWLLDHASVDAGWCLVHATHLDAGEIGDLAGSGAVVGLCPTTEANLGDGIFPLSEYQQEGGRWAVGTDSHVGRGVVGELRLLEYGQRLSRRARNVVAGPGDRSTGRALLDAAWAGGAAACGRRIGRLAEGFRADMVVLDGDHPALAGREEDDLLDAWIFSGDDNPVTDVLVGGRHVVRDGRHLLAEETAAAYRPLARALRADSAQIKLDL